MTLRVQILKCKQLQTAYTTSVSAFLTAIRVRILLVIKATPIRVEQQSGTDVWYVPPDPEQREAAMASPEALGGFLSERLWMERILDQTYTNLNKLSDWGYPFPVDDQGRPHRRSPRWSVSDRTRGSKGDSSLEIFTRIRV